jgi:hypothetical protein
LVRVSLLAAAKRLRKNRRASEGLTSGAEARMHIENLAARLNVVPFPICLFDLLFPFCFLGLSSPSVFPLCLPDLRS